MGTNTGIGIGIGIPFKNNALGGDNMYFPPELKARMIGVWDNYGKKNTDADRNIIKNKIPNAGGDLEILNSVYRLNSGFGGYSNDFQEYTYHENVVIKTDTNVVFNAGGQLLIPYSSLTKDVPSFKIKVSGLSNTYHFRYYYRDNNGVQHSVNMAKDGNYELPICYNVQNSSDGTNCGFANNGSDIITVEILPAFEGALVTDGINDIIASIKTLEEWNIGDKGITIVSMIHQINTNTNNFITTNNIRTDNKIIGRNIVSNIEKTGIYGWYKENIQSDTINVINNILGDKNDYTSHSSPSTNINPINNSKFYVQGYAVENGFAEISSIAHYWTFAVLGKATEDEINLIIGNYNLDRSLKPDILCNITKQGLTNENHAEFNDKLIDYSGNGRDLQLFNIGWKGESGIGRYTEEFKNDYWIVHRDQTGIIKDGNSIKVVGKISNYYIVYHSRLKATNGFKVKIKGIKAEIIYNYISSDKEQSISFKEDGIYDIPASEAVDSTFTLGFYFRYNDINLDWTGLTIEIIPSHAGALCLDGINDFGKVTGMPIYKDYTVVADYERFNIGNIEGIGTPPVLSKSYTDGQGSFIMNFIASTGNSIHSYSFGAENTRNFSDLARQIFYQSKYKSQGFDITAGTGIDGDSLWLGTARDNDSRFFNGAIYSLMSFPYSMSEFLIERQLKKHKLGTLYPDMVEFRPVIKANNDYEIVYTAIIKPDNWQEISIGDYVTVGKSVAIQIKLNLLLEVTNVSSNSLADVSFYKEETGDNVYTIYGRLLDGKSPQKINITIDEYIRFEDIVQPYPVLLRFKDENGNEVSWGGKFKVGSTITRIGSIADPESNLLNGLYSISGLSLNGKGVTSSTSIVEKQMVFKTIATYLLDNNEPKCILSPRLLRIPNSSYKILGHIPDISGHGNHGKINNSAYAEGSGVNEDGSYQFDGVDDFVTIPTTVGGKQVLMKVNWQKEDTMIYNQNPGEDNFAIFANDYNNNNLVNAYASRNNGSTYIDGILNNNILATQLKDVTHNITITNENVVNNTIVPVIGANAAHNNFYAQMALYDFMLFDEISTDDKIKELNEYVGIEAKPKQGLLQPSITVNGSYVVLDTVEDTNDYLVNGTADCGIGFSDESASKQFSTGVTYDKNFSYSIIVIANNNKELISLSHNGVSADSIQSMDYSETTKLYICSTTNGMFAVGSAPQEIIIELSD